MKLVVDKNADQLCQAFGLEKNWTTNQSDTLSEILNLSDCKADLIENLWNEFDTDEERIIAIWEMSAALARAEHNLKKLDV